MNWAPPPINSARQLGAIFAGGKDCATSGLPSWFVIDYLLAVPGKISERGRVEPAR